MYKLTHIDVQVKSHGSSTTFRTRWARVRHLGRHDAAYNNDFRDFTRSPLIRARAPRRRAGRSVHGGQLRPIAHRLPGCGCASRGCAEPSAIDSSATVWAWTGIAPQSAEVSRTTLHPRARARVAGWTASGSVHPQWSAAWSALLARPSAEICDKLREPSEHMAALRQVTPFAGVLDARTRWALWRSVPR